MTTYVALLRAVNVGGTGKLPMADLKALCTQAGLSDVETYIASGNVVGSSEAPSAAVKTALEAALRTYAGKPVGVMVRTAAELAAIVAANPFADAPGHQVVAIFLDAAPPPDAIAAATGRRNADLALGVREIYVRYGNGMGTSKLKMPAAKAGTARNMNTVRKLAEMAAKR